MGQDCARREALGGYVLGQLDEPAARELDVHLAGCPSCRAELAEIAPLVAGLRRLDPDRVEAQPPPELWAEIQARIAAEREAD
ncbi:MAG TPA: zf-HC2 domain-containing protein [Actinophytocola sp.]|uniref:zf-HC2 domain-containing protein n=1 Tax=Actinophytocola sp. TaxID=1872138 RepID=UPI002DBC1ADC|nr:zf-HC2 domain-containing protein [Actinophytocola sp.]HEU5472683.1 zf-HC2 domain-containing protein [Actinophytocola sp.]